MAGWIAVGCLGVIIIWVIFKAISPKDILPLAAAGCLLFLVFWREGMALRVRPCNRSFVGFKFMSNSKSMTHTNGPTSELAT